MYVTMLVVTCSDFPLPLTHQLINNKGSELFESEKNTVWILHIRVWCYFWVLVLSCRHDTVLVYKKGKQLQRSNKSSPHILRLLNDTFYLSRYKERTNGKVICAQEVGHYSDPTMTLWEDSVHLLGRYKSYCKLQYINYNCGVFIKTWPAHDLMACEAI